MNRAPSDKISLKVVLEKQGASVYACIWDLSSLKMKNVMYLVAFPFHRAAVHFTLKRNKPLKKLLNVFAVSVPYIRLGVLFL